MSEFGAGAYKEMGVFRALGVLYQNKLLTANEGASKILNENIFGELRLYGVKGIIALTNQEENMDSERNEIKGGILHVEFDTNKLGEISLTGSYLTGKERNTKYNGVIAGFKDEWADEETLQKVEAVHMQLSKIGHTSSLEVRFLGGKAVVGFNYTYVEGGEQKTAWIGYLSSKDLNKGRWIAFASASDATLGDNSNKKLIESGKGLKESIDRALLDLKRSEKYSDVQFAVGYSAPLEIYYENGNKDVLIGNNWAAVASMDINVKRGSSRKESGRVDITLTYNMYKIDKGSIIGDETKKITFEGSLGAYGSGLYGKGLDKYINITKVDVWGLRSSAGFTFSDKKWSGDSEVSLNLLLDIARTAEGIKRKLGLELGIGFSRVE